MATYCGPSTIDGKNSFHLNYRPFNEDNVKSMHDELRKVNDDLYIGMGHMAFSGGAINPIPFVLFRENAKN